jgi:hypothetical protein
MRRLNACTQGLGSLRGNCPGSFIVESMGDICVEGKYGAVD